MAPREISELLVVSITPQNLERGVLPCPPNAEPSGDAGGWFKENLSAIKKARLTNPWWRDNCLIVEKDLVLKPSELTRRLVELGYERASSVPGRGLFAVRGGVTEIWPINAKRPYLVEFAGNTISEIREREEAEEKITPRIPARSIEKLSPGSYVVHVDHGIGIFQGKNADEKFFVIEYAPAAIGRTPDRLYVPVDQKDRLMPYVGFETPRIHRLGGAIWSKTKRKVREDTEKLAKELLALYATREIAERPPHHGDTSLENELRGTFPYKETEDQLHAEREIMGDLERKRPMDRILCGDVGFGKTELAIRAALRVISSGKQVAVLAPTTVLAAQHEKTFKERLGGPLPVTVAMLSRLTSPKDEKRMLQALADGAVDCIIGTHRLLSKDVVFKNLGLVIIDEEQRFGVRHKEHFKNLRQEIDILSLSATPIPRTLSFALAKLRDISLIETPPPERLPIQTFILPYSIRTIRRAIEFELQRGGQIYFLHNRIETITLAKEKIYKSLKTCKLKPHAGVIHGRMKEKEIMKTMDAFRNKEVHILLATTIIENGLDISSANTLIVDEATRLGLAEAHQLRGRIGRANLQAFAYFLYKPRHLTSKAAERLEALKEYSELGAGYQIALRDLEIRGAGNILGKEQSGAINKVGLNLYCQMLAEALENQKATLKKVAAH